MIFSLAYVSYASEKLTETDIQNIFDYTVDWNINHHISGFLIYSDRNFVQLLEGDEQEIQDLFSRISADKRHKNIIVLLKQKTPYRAFDDYKSGFLISSNKLHTELKGYLNYLRLLEDPQVNKTIGTIEGILKGM